MPPFVHPCPRGVRENFSCYPNGAAGPSKQLSAKDKLAWRPRPRPNLPKHPRPGPFPSFPVAAVFDVEAVAELFESNAVVVVGTATALLPFPPLLPKLLLVVVVVVDGATEELAVAAPSFACPPCPLPAVAVVAEVVVMAASLPPSTPFFPLFPFPSRDVGVVALAEVGTAEETGVLEAPAAEEKAAAAAARLAAVLEAASASPTFALASPSSAAQMRMQSSWKTR